MGYYANPPLFDYILRYHKPPPSAFLMHHGIKGQKWGVRRTPEELGHRPKNAVEKTDSPGIIRTTVTGHATIPKRSTPNSIMDHLGSDGKVDSRSFYDSTGLKVKDIHMTDHGHPKYHLVVPHDDYIWDEKNGKLDRTTRALTETERKENKE